MMRSLDMRREKLSEDYTVAYKECCHNTDDQSQRTNVSSHGALPPLGRRSRANPFHCRRNVNFITQVTDTPGIPDTDRKKSLQHYDKVIEYLRGAPTISAIVIVVAEGRKDERVYRDMRALMKQFNTLPCAKIMVFRSTLPPRCKEERRRNIDRLATEAMNKLCDAAGLRYTMQCILHNMDDNEVQSLRNLICKMPATTLGGQHLRIFSEIRSDFEKLSEANTRMEAVEKELGRLSGLKTENEDKVRNLAARLDNAEREERIAKQATSFLGPFAALGNAVVDLASKSPGYRKEKQNAEARVKEISEDMAGKQKELDEGRINPDDLAKAKAEFDELDILGRD
ncbi:unnamed protein product [Ectocarpus sp. 12 AP-2014]